MMFYPLSGFIADVCCGRLKVVIASLCFLLACVITACLMEITVLVSSVQKFPLNHFKDYLLLFDSFPGTIVLILGHVSTIAFFIGLAGYQANFIQLGLDIWASSFITPHGLPNLDPYQC